MDVSWGGTTPWPPIGDATMEQRTLGRLVGHPRRHTERPAMAKAMRIRERSHPGLGGSTASTVEFVVLTQWQVIS